MKTTLLLVLIALVGEFMSDELKSWSIWLHTKLRRMAVAKLPAAFRDRYDEEWESGLAEVPGEIFKLLYSTGLIWSAIGIYRASVTGTTHTKRALTLLKRIFDIGLSSLVLALSLPFMLVIALAVKLSSNGTIFYVAECIGKNGRLFRCYTFRTMAFGRSTSVSHPTNIRVTSIGRILRKYSLDELPRFFNVLRGDMTIVGRRPIITNKAS